MLATLHILAVLTVGRTDTLLVSPAWLSAHLGQPDIVVVHIDRDDASCTLWAPNAEAVLVDGEPVAFVRDGAYVRVGAAAVGVASSTPRLRVFPQPARGTATIVVDVPHPGSLTVDVFDVAGRRVRRLWQGPVVAGLFFFGLAMLFFVVGFCAATVYKRWGNLVLTVVLVSLGFVLIGAMWLVGQLRAWGDLFAFFGSLTPIAVTGGMVLVGALLAALSYGMLRRAIA